MNESSLLNLPLPQFTHLQGAAGKDIYPIEL